MRVSAVPERLMSRPVFFRQLLAKLEVEARAPSRLDSQTIRLSSVRFRDLGEAPDPLVLVRAITETGLGESHNSVAAAEGVVVANRDDERQLRLPESLRELLSKLPGAGIGRVQLPELVELRSRGFEIAASEGTTRVVE